MIKVRENGPLRSNLCYVRIENTDDLKERKELADGGEAVVLRISD